MEPSDSDLVETTHHEGVLIVRLLTKRLDASVAPRFKTAVTDHIASGHQYLVLDLTAVDFMDSSALGAVVSCMKAVGSRGSLAISGAHGTVMKLFKLTRLDRILNLHDTPEGAAQAIKPS
jgi:anti-sigma B factor antagonist